MNKDKKKTPEDFNADMMFSELDILEPLNEESMDSIGGASGQVEMHVHHIGDVLLSSTDIPPTGLPGVSFPGATETPTGYAQNVEAELSKDLLEGYKTKLDDQMETLQQAEKEGINITPDMVHQIESADLQQFKAAEGVITQDCHNLAQTLEAQHQVLTNYGESEFANYVSNQISVTSAYRNAATEEDNLMNSQGRLWNPEQGGLMMQGIEKDMENIQQHSTTFDELKAQEAAHTLHELENDPELAASCHAEMGSNPNQNGGLSQAELQAISNDPSLDPNVHVTVEQQGGFVGDLDKAGSWIEQHGGLVAGVLAGGIAIALTDGAAAPEVIAAEEDAAATETASEAQNGFGSGSQTGQGSNFNQSTETNQMNEIQFRDEAQDVYNKVWKDNPNLRSSTNRNMLNSDGEALVKEDLQSMDNPLGNDTDFTGKSPLRGIRYKANE